MAITLNHVKEQLSRAYVTAIAAKAGATVSKPDLDYGIDATVQFVRQLPSGKFQPTGFVFHCQLKATTTCAMEDGYVVYDMEADAYNKLANWEGNSPCILILLRLPEEEHDWLLLNEEQLLLRNCCYWMHITDPPSDNSSSCRIRIPRQQVFTPEVVAELLEKVRNGEM